MAKNLNSYPLPPSMTPERPSSAKGGNGDGTTTSLSESWKSRLSAIESESRTRRQPPSSEEGGGGNEHGRFVEVGRLPPESNARSSRASFDIEQQSAAAPTKGAATKTSTLLDFLSKKMSSSFDKASDRPYSNASRRKESLDPPPPSPSTPSRAKDDESSFQQSPSSQLSQATPQTPRSQQSQPPPPTPPISQSFSTGRSTYTVQPRRYKGFSTPFCGLFATSGSLPTADHLHPQLHNQEDFNHHRREVRTAHFRTDLCSLPCFGMLQADHTRYLFTHGRPPTLCRRMCLHFFTPLTLFLIAGYCAGHIRNEYANSVVCTALVYCIIVWIVSGCMRGRKKRVMVREEILWRLRRREEKLKKRAEERRERGMLGGNVGGTAPPDALMNNVESEEYEYYSEDEYEYQKSGYGSTLGQTRFEMNCAHRLAGCYPSDIARESCCSNGTEVDDYVLQREFDEGGDLCTRLWSCFARPCLPCVPCCNDSMGFHLQFCGLCALAQEAREANLTLPRHLRMVDYVTMEPFLLYYPRIVELRRSATNSFWEHCQAISALSRMLLVSFKVILVALAIMSVSNAIGYWELKDMMVLITTFLQSFMVMYCVHWGWHRYDLSIDAVIKYFACGFVLCTSMAFAVELFEYLTFQASVTGLVWWLEVGEVDSSGYGGGSMHVMFDGHGRSLAKGADVLQGFLNRNPAVRLFYVLVSSYLMAGLVEEVCKYFGFVMVDHPDFCSEREMEKAKATMPLQILRDREEDDDEEEDGPGEKSEGKIELPAMDEALANFNPAMQRRSLSSIRSGVTVAMVAVALGFACCENLLNIFIYNRSSLRSEITTLIVKSLFPVHPIAAAIQSIYVCRRDLEKDPSIGLGRIVLPSVLLHGTYDFALLLISSSWQRSHKEQYFYQGGSMTVVAVLSFCASLFIVMTGGVYYAFSSRAQYARLRGESGSGDTRALSEASFGLLL